MKTKKYLFLIIILILVIIYSISLSIYETFDIYNSIDYYVISMKNKQDRIDNINEQQSKIPKLKLQVVDAVNGNAMSDQEFKQLYDNGVLAKDRYEYAIETKHGKGEVGCYLSHIKIYNMVKNSSSKYSVVFEDDFEITIDFENQLNDILDKVENVDFDFIFLGNSSGNKDDSSIHLKDNIYYFNKKNWLSGTYGYLINNSKINNIIENTKYMDRPIDHRIPDLCKDNVFKILVIHPVIVEHKPPNGTTLEGFVVK
jgi:glycosyl transferase family 25